MTSANSSNAIVHSLFPKNVRDRLMEDALGDNGKATKDGGNMMPFSVSPFSNAYDPATAGRMVVSRPIADLFVEATIMFADIANFTAWCSV
jgi:hypothetical protein